MAQVSHHQAQGHQVSDPSSLITILNLIVMSRLSRWLKVQIRLKKMNNSGSSCRSVTHSLSSSFSISYQSRLNRWLRTRLSINSYPRNRFSILTSPSSSTILFLIWMMSPSLLSLPFLFLLAVSSTRIQGILIALVP